MQVYLRKMYIFSCRRLLNNEKIFLIADTHFGDEGMRKYENRPFADVADMDEELVSRWNEVVKQCVKEAMREE